MDTWKFYAVTHEEHTVCNPMSLAKLDRLIEPLGLARGSRVVEIACGKGEFLVRLAERYGVSGIGVDISPFFVADARAKLAQRIPEARIEIVEMDGADFSPPAPGSLDLAACIGASWIYHGHRGTLDALVPMVAPGGWVVVGEPHWRRPPPAEYLAVTGDKADAFGSHAGNVAVAEELGLHLVYAIVSDENDWDEYEGLQWHAAERYARAHPGDPDIAELERRVAEQKRAYLRWGRDTLGFAIYAFRKPGGPPVG